MTIVYACITTHHLLDHKPDNLLRTGHKFRLNGFYKFGTPGIGVCWGDQDGVDGFVEKMKGAMPQKKFGLVFSRSWDGAVPTSGWTEVTASGLRGRLSEAGVDDDDYYSILGIQKRDGNDDEDGGKTGGKKKGGKAKAGKKKK